MLPDLIFLHEDNHVLAVDKPPGILSQGDLTGDLDVLTLAKAIIKRRDRKPGNVYLGLVHRLDRPVGGVMIIAKTSKAAGRLSKQLRERETIKIYHAVVEGVPEPSTAELIHRLRKDRSKRITSVVGPGEDGKEARLIYRVIEHRGDRSMVEVTLITGIAHQIRVQLSHIGHPIIGDRKYGSKTPSAGGKIALHATSITFQHPTKNQPVTISSDTPQWF